jgi:hypothetical protein
VREALLYTCAYHKPGRVEFRRGDRPQEGAAQLNIRRVLCFASRERSPTVPVAIAGCFGERRFGLMVEAGSTGQAACRSYR